MDGLIEAFTGSPDPEAARRIAEAKKLAANYISADISRLAENQPHVAQTPDEMVSKAVPAKIRPEMADQVRYGFQPGVNEYGDPMSFMDDNAANRVADTIERRYGTFENQPSWRNADDYAKAGAEYARNNADNHYGSVDEAYTASRQLLSPERYAYMQDVGRTVDLLRGLKDTPVTSTSTYKDSYKQPLARDGLNIANYERFGDGSVAQDFFSDPTSPVAWYLRTSNSIPSTIRSTADSASTAAANALGQTNFTNRFRLGPVAVMDLPSNATPEQYRQRAAEVEKLAQDVAPPSWQHVVGKAPPVVADAVGFFGEMLDPSVVASSITGAPGMLAGLKTAPSLASKAATAAGAFGRSSVGELKPEAMFAAPQWAAQASMPVERTWQDYLFGAGQPEQRNPEVTTRAANILDSLKRNNPQDIWQSRNRYNPLPMPVAREADVGAMY
jgi:hypothetical protein